MAFGLVLALDCSDQPFVADYQLDSSCLALLAFVGPFGLACLAFAVVAAAANVAVD